MISTGGERDPETMFREFAETIAREVQRVVEAEWAAKCRFGADQERNERERRITALFPVYSHFGHFSDTEWLADRLWYLIWSG
jgi:hypothetical protein